MVLCPRTTNWASLTSSFLLRINCAYLNHPLWEMWIKHAPVNHPHNESKSALQRPPFLKPFCVLPYCMCSWPSLDPSGCQPMPLNWFLQETLLFACCWLNMTVLSTSPTLLVDFMLLSPPSSPLPCHLVVPWVLGQSPSPQSGKCWHPLGVSSVTCHLYPRGGWAGALQGSGHCGGDRSPSTGTHSVS